MFTLDETEEKRLTFVEAVMLTDRSTMFEIDSIEDYTFDDRIDAIIEQFLDNGVMSGTFYMEDMEIEFSIIQDGAMVLLESC